MKKILIFLILLTSLLTGCRNPQCAQIVATTLPVWEFTSALCQGTDIEVTRLITDEISCLHDYALDISQMQAIEAASAVVCSGWGLETFLDDILDDAVCVIDASVDITLVNDEDHTDDDHHDEHDMHIWLSVNHAKQMCRTICAELTALYPKHESVLSSNLFLLTAKLDALQAYGENALKQLECREMITFHDGFSYFADGFGLHILKAVEEESGSEASAQELIELITLVKDHNLPAVFTEANGSTAAAKIISAETGAEIYSLDMAMSGDSYFHAMYHNIDTVKGALG